MSFETEEADPEGWDAAIADMTLTRLSDELYEVTMDLQIRCVRVELLSRDRHLLVPIAQLKRDVVRLENDPIVNADAIDRAHHAYSLLGEQAKRTMAVHGLERPLVTDADPWRVRRREYKRALKAGEAAVVAPPVWTHLWEKLTKRR